MIQPFYFYPSYINECYNLIYRDIIACCCDSAEYHPRRKKLKYYQKRK